MIVRIFGDRLQLITQPAHAQLSGRIMQHAARLEGHPRRAEILHAIAEHDNGWAEEDAAPLVQQETGEILDFVNAPLSVRHRVWPRAVVRLAGDPWAAALVAQHAITVYDRFKAEQAWTSFFAGMETACEAMVLAAGLPRADLRPDYAFVRLGDLVSLTFCTGWTEAQRFDEWTVQRSADRVLVSPDPFGGVVIPFEIEAREIAARRFGSHGDLREALRQAERRVLQGAVEGR